jgi:hypothetical protein
MSGQRAGELNGQVALVTGATRGIVSLAPRSGERVRVRGGR